MRCHLPGILLGVTVAVCGPSFGQEKSAKNDANGVEVRFADDSLVKMFLQSDRIEIATRYGKLTLPAADIRRIEFGLRVPEETAKRIDAAIARLGSPDFKQRDAASVELLALRELAYPALHQASRGTDSEASRRAREAVKAIADAVPPGQL